jgi:hypothetical protein
MDGQNILNNTIRQDNKLKELPTNHTYDDPPF